MFFKKNFPWIILLPIIFTFSSGNTKNRIETARPDSTFTFTLSFVGDIMCHSPQYEYAQVLPDSFNFSPVFRYVKKYLSASEYTFGNLETVTSGGKISGYPLFNTPSQILDALKDAGFDFLFTANNHCLDRSERGVLNTISELKKRLLPYTGTSSSWHDRDSIKIIDIKGVKIALLAYTYGTNGNPIPKGKEYLVNLIDTLVIKKDIIRAKSFFPDLTIVYFHFGEEYKTEPNRFQEIIAERTAGYGADAIIASHPHVIQPLRFVRNNVKNDSIFAAYSLGNFISNQRGRYKDSGVILNLQFEKNYTSKDTYLKEFSFIPTWVFKGSINGKNEFLVLPCEEDINDSSFSFLSQKDIADINRSSEDTKSILLKYISSRKDQEKMGLNKP